MSLTEYRARRARLGFDDNPVPVVSVPPVPSELSHELEELRDALKAAQEKLTKREGEIGLLRAQLEAAKNANPGFNGRKIVTAVAKCYGLTFFDLLKKRRTPHLVRARHHAMWELKRSTFMSFPEIAKLLGGMDHTTVMHGVRKHQERIEAGEVA